MDIASLLAETNSFETMLDTLYDSTIPLVEQFITPGRAIGGIGALLFITYKAVGPMMRNERIDFFPMLRPFVVGMCIMLFPQLCQTLRAVTGLLSHMTDAIRTEQNVQIAQLNEQKKALMDAKAENQDFATDDAYEKKIKELSGWTNVTDRVVLSFNKTTYDVQKNFREWMLNFFELAHVAARLLISLIATIMLVVLSIMGPIAFGLSLLPGFSGGVQKWLGNFLTISLWVPVANMVGAFMGNLQVLMLQNDIHRLQTSTTVGAIDWSYLLFLVLCIGAYFCVPRLTELLIAHSGAGQAAAAFMGGATQAAGHAGAGAGMAGAGALGAAGGAGAFVNAVGGSALGSSAGRAQQYGHAAGAAVGRLFRRPPTPSS